MDTIKINSKKTKIIAHRGLSGIELENTCSSFIAAANRSYFGIETDVHCTLDNKFIIHHDNSTKRLSTKTLEIEKTEYKVLRELQLTKSNNLARTDYKMPNMEEYLSICQTYNKNCIIELKNEFSKPQVKKLVKLIEKSSSAEFFNNNIIFISFWPNNLINLRELLPTAHLQFLYNHPVNKDVFGLLTTYNLNLDLEYPYITKDLIKTLHKQGKKVNCWTLDDPTIAKKLISWGIDYITTNILE